jgi:ABC-type enterochelin transport system ATPase subunit
MIRTARLAPLVRLPARLAAFGAACAITTVIVVIHTVDLASLGAHEVVAAAMAPAVVASAAADTPHVDAVH